MFKKLKALGLIETELWYPFRNYISKYRNILTTCLDKELIVNEFSPRSSKCTIWHVWHIFTECLKRNLPSHLPNTEEKHFIVIHLKGVVIRKSFSRLFQTVPADDATLSHLKKNKKSTTNLFLQITEKMRFRYINKGKLPASYQHFSGYVERSSNAVKYSEFQFIYVQKNIKIKFN